MAYKDKHDPRLKASRLKHYYANKEQYFLRNKVSRAKMRLFIDSFKDKECMDCHIKYPPYVTQFDHIGTDKEYNIADLATHGSYSKVENEVKKCDVVCANCHAIRTHNRRLKNNI